MFNKNLVPKSTRSFDPWSSFQNEFKDLVSRFNEDWVPQETSISHFVPNVEIKDRDKSYLVTAEIPGMEEKDLDISLEENVLILKGERQSESQKEEEGFFSSEISYGRFYRALPLKDEVDEDKIEAHYDKGLLKVTLPKKANASRKAKKISLSQSTDTKH